MTHSTAVPVDPELATAFKNAAESASDSPRYFVVKIENETLKLAYTHATAGGVSSDYQTIVSHVGASAAYILFRFGSKNWLLITYVPETVKVNEKMIYAATKGTLKRELGYQNFSDELHANDEAELSWANYEGKMKPVNALSEYEEQHRAILKAEQEEAASRRPPAAAGGAGAGAASSGYHAVKLPLDATATAAIDAVKGGTATLAELAVNDAKNGVIGVKSVALSAGESLAGHLHSSEPRFYLYARLAGVTRVYVFLYVCPDAAPHQLRMVYSTAKTSVSSAITTQGVRLAKSLESSDPSEVTDKWVSDALKPAAVTASAGAAPGFTASGRPKSANVSHMEKPHPVYSLMSSGGSSPTTTKKIVMPPPGAW